MTTYYTRKDQVSLKPGEKLGFTTGKGYYAILAPAPALAPPPPAKATAPSAKPPSPTPVASPPAAPAVATPTAATPEPPPTASPTASPNARQPVAASSLPPPIAWELKATSGGPTATLHAVQPTKASTAGPNVAYHPERFHAPTPARPVRELEQLTGAHGIVVNVEIRAAAPQRDWHTALRLALGGGAQDSSTSAPAAVAGTGSMAKSSAKSSENNPSRHADPIQPAPAAMSSNDSNAKASHSASDGKPPARPADPTNQRIARAYHFFRAKGLTHEESAAVVGNLIYESGGHLNPAQAQFGGGPGRGIAQWTLGSSRWSSLLDLAGKEHASPSRLDVQLEFVWQELNTTFRYALKALKEAPGLAAATTAFEKYYEAAGDPHLPDRIADARSVFTHFTR